MTGVCMTGVCIQATFYEWNAIDVVYHERQRDHDDQKTDHSHQVSDVKDPLAFWFLLLMCVRCWECVEVFGLVNVWALSYPISRILVYIKQ